MNFKSKFLFALPVITIILVASSSFKKQTFDLKASIERGKDLYIVYCLSCHMDSGEGMQDMQRAVEPRQRESIDRVGEDRHRQFRLEYDARARNEALQRAKTLTPEAAK